jgi:hypothetical protein
VACVLWKQNNESGEETVKIMKCWLISSNDNQWNETMKWKVMPYQ